MSVTARRAATGGQASAPVGCQKSACSCELRRQTGERLCLGSPGGARGRRRAVSSCCRAASGARASMAVVTALPADSQQEDPLDPERILRVLPDRERETFLAQYQQAVDGAHDPAGWKHLKRFLRLWAGRAIAANRPGFYEARDRALAGTGGGMLLDNAIRQYRTGR